jgi:DNA-binding protein HU-beta
MATKNPRVTQDELVATVKHYTGASSRDAASAVLRAVVQAIVFHSGRGKLVVKGLGTFETTLRKARKARNPMTGESVDVPAREVLTFKCSKLLQRD